MEIINFIFTHIDTGILLSVFFLLIKAGWLFRNALLSLIRGQIVQDHENLCKTKMITFTRLDALEQMYVAYHSLGGNGSVTRCMEDIRKLEVCDNYECQ